MSGQKTFHILMVVMTRNDDHKTWGVADRTNELSCPDDLIKYLRPPSHGMDEGRQAINKKFQYLGRLSISCQTVGSSSKPALISPEALQKEH